LKYLSLLLAFNFLLSINTNAQSDTASVYEYPVPLKDINEHLRRNLKYPPNPRDEGYQGRVVLTFLINEAGKMDSLLVYRSVHPTIDAEALRVVSLLNEWRPGKVNGIPVKVYFVLPIDFRLEGDRTARPFANGEFKSQFFFHDEHWFYKEGERLYELDSLEKAAENFQNAFLINRTNLGAAYNFAAIQFSLGHTKEGCVIIKSLVRNGYKPAEELQKQYCNKVK
jgi:TonB family protein